MSMYWSGGTMSGLILKGNDIEYFKKKYVEMNPHEFKGYAPHERSDIIDEWLSCNEKFNYAADGNGNVFYAQYYDGNNFEGLYFSQASEENCSSYMIDDRELPIVFIETKKPLMSRWIIKKGFYSSVEEMAEEFKKELGAYLPPDFDYESAIGDLSYAFYA